MTHPSPAYPPNREASPPYKPNTRTVTEHKRPTTPRTDPLESGPSGVKPQTALFQRLGSVYAPGSLYAVNDGDEWHLAAYSGEAFYAAASDRDYPRTWRPIEIDRAVLVVGAETP